MKNMKIGMKLILGFAIVALITAIVGVVGAAGIKSTDTAYSISYVVQAQPVPLISYAINYTQHLRVTVRNMIIFAGDQDKLKTYAADMDSQIQELEKYIAAYDSTIVNPDARKMYDDAKAAYSNTFKPLILQAKADALAGAPQAQLAQILTQTSAAVNLMLDNFTKCMDIKVKAGATESDELTAQTNMLFAIMIAVSIIGVIIAMLLGLYIAQIISNPVKRMRQLMHQVGTTGDMIVDPALKTEIDKDASFKDEIGEMGRAFKVLIEHITNVADSLATIADGDLTANIKILGDKDILGVSLAKTQDSLNKMFSEINSSSNQVSTGSVQIADGAQLLAQGATEQSATVEELSASISEIASQTKRNSGIANEARDLGETIKTSAEQGSRQMQQMMQAVQEINDSSKSIGKVIKIIDDIAFQTNILALNAAVEAARAGQHGKGFAVVADEVRSLAAKSAEAAKNTNELIESSIQKAEQGASISAETSESLQQIVSGILRSSELVADIAKSSNEQTISISQISDAIDQVSQVVQQNSATAEESAAASEEMSGQATLLQQLIAQFKLKNISGGVASMGGFKSPAPKSMSSGSSRMSSGFSMDSGSKY